jgi:hypothetical protein
MALRSASASSFPSAGVDTPSNFSAPFGFCGIFAFATSTGVPNSESNGSPTSDCRKSSEPRTP